MNKAIIFLLIGALVHCGCGTEKQDKIPQTQSAEMKCLFFFIPDCPACRNCFKSISKLNDKYAGNGLEVISYLSDPYPEDSVLISTLNLYDYHLPIVLDSSLDIARSFGITTTPQFLLIDSLDNIIYSGNLDNAYYSFGKHSAKIDEHYLEDAIIAYLNGVEIEIKETTPIGCKINYELN